MSGWSKQSSHERDPEQPLPPVPAISLYGMLSPLLLTPALLAPAIALFAPVDVLDRWPPLRRFTDFMVRWVPFMDVHANSTIHPQMALLVNCLVVAAVPVLAAIVAWQSWVNYPYLLKRRQQQGRLELKQHFVIFLGPFVGVFAIAAMVMIAGDPSWAAGATTHRRGFYALAAFVLPYFTGFGFGTQLLNVRLFIDTYLRQGAKK